MNNKSTILLFALITGMIISGCSNNADTIVSDNTYEKSENSFFSDELKISDDCENTDNLTVDQNLVLNDNYSYISDVSVMNDEIFISGQINAYHILQT